ncbi:MULTISPECIES: glycosyltransferase family 2 protein [Rhizobium]|uniref:Glycosyltransferase n=1 Tax=Rhizobium tropici TaxID=398 RepID=A0A6P1CIE8_RHITR|nr:MULTISPECIES: glycosyltransferase [Rhizobium]AGB74957.1 putative bifunctional GT-A/GT-B family glycosyl transferase [Rhizobium tropici CIAT 899]MBB4242021.1 glycosyltransferase involved in cell wall biosynthesis [Rhizobium tropici]MBB5593954.1 glycosyltransferase involved in cell wall biosynthesis [Rhizobium tropici]MBB6492346.1 glycosyltransferase involved in cell wall biosynthesis [Rhizobium tropici]NEV15375.1 glycosyltransferase [Rhizobium tropici]
MKICVIVEQFHDVLIGFEVSFFGCIIRSLRSDDADITVLVTDLSRGSFGHYTGDTHGCRVEFLSDFAAAKDCVYPPVDHASKAYCVYLFVKERGFEQVHSTDQAGIAFYLSLAKKQNLINTEIITYICEPTRLRRSVTMNAPEINTLEEETMAHQQLLNSDIIVAPTKHIANLYQLQQKSHDVSCKILSLRRPTRNEDEEEIDKNRSISRIVYAGSLDNWGGIQLFLDTLDVFPADFSPDIIFLSSISTFNSENSAGFILRNLRSYAGSIIFTDSLRFDDLWSFLDSETLSTVFVFPSKYFVNPYLVLECLRRSFSVVSVVGNGAEEILKGERCCQIAEGNPPALYRAIKTLESRSAQVGQLSYFFAFEENLMPQPAVSRAGQPFISVCLTHYERTRLLDRALTYLARQSYLNFEVIVVDDGSPSSVTHKELSLIERRSYPFSLRIIRSENRYLGAARNLAASQAQGEYLLFHDDDNFAEPSELELFVKAALNSNSELLTSLFFTSYDDGLSPDLAARKIEIFPIGIGGVFSFFKNSFGDANFFILRDTFFRLGGFTELRDVGREDWEFLIRAWLADVRMGVVPEPLFNYRISDEGMRNHGNLAADHERIYSLLNHNVVTDLSDLLRYADQNRKKENFLARLSRLLPAGLNIEYFRALGDMEPNSFDAVKVLSELELAKPSYGLRLYEYPHVDRLDAYGPGPRSGLDDYLLLEGWAVLDGGRWLPDRFRVGKNLYQVISFVRCSRIDVANLYLCDAEVGFAALVRRRRSFVRRWPLVKFGSSSNVDIRANLDDRSKKLIGHIDKITNYHRSPLMYRNECVSWINVRTRDESWIFLGDADKAESIVPTKVRRLLINCTRRLSRYLYTPVLTDCAIQFGYKQPKDALLPWFRS